MFTSSFFTFVVSARQKGCLMGYFYRFCNTWPLCTLACSTRQIMQLLLALCPSWHELTRSPCLTLHYTTLHMIYIYGLTQYATPVPSSKLGTVSKLESRKSLNVFVSTQRDGPFSDEEESLALCVGLAGSCMPWHELQAPRQMPTTVCQEIRFPGDSPSHGA